MSSPQSDLSVDDGAQERRQLLALDLAGLLQQLGVTAVVRNPETEQALAYTDDAISVYGQGAAVRVERALHLLSGVAFLIETPAAGAGHRPLDLTPRQGRILEMIAAGLRNREIAEQLGISPHTVRRHVEALLRRLNVPTRAAAAVLLRSPATRPRRGGGGVTRVA